MRMRKSVVHGDCMVAFWLMARLEEGGVRWKLGVVYPHHRQEFVEWTDCLISH